ncbi:MAG: Na+/H+ antiporter subunit E [Actinomycetota bacterium]|nr:Na+/H+ antiporter subunit E [Actinomycetota bacterium]
MRAELRRDTPRGLLVRRIAPRVALLALLWWALNGDNAGSWWVGAPAIAAAALVGVALSPRAGPSPTLLGTLRFVPFFLRQSLVGGADVALRALRPSLPLAPDFLEYRLRLPMGPPRPSWPPR